MTPALQLLKVARLCYERGLVCGVEGNLSIRVGDNEFLSTAAATCKGRLTEEDIVRTDKQGKPTNKLNRKKPSTELKMHLAAYAARPDVKAIVHAHPTIAVAFSVAGRRLSDNILPEVVCTLGSIPIAPYATPSTDEVADSMARLLDDHDVIVLDHHGALALGADIWDAFYKMETLEHHAQTLFYAELLGGARPLSQDNVTKLLNIRSVYGLKRPVRVELKD